MSMPTVSAVIPAYNCAQYLPETLESVFKQTCPLHEIIVVDDGSTDDTAAVLQQYQDRVTILMQPNAGAAAARNTGIRRATGDWIAFLDADDLWLPDKTAVQLELLAKNPQAVVLYGQMQNFAPSGELHDILPDRVCQTEADKELIPYLACLYLMPPTPTVLARRDVLHDAGLFPEGLETAEDLDLWVRMLRFGPFVGLPRVVMRRRLRHDSLTATHDGIRQYQRYLQVCRHRRADIRRWAGAWQPAGPCFIHTLLARLHLDAGARGKALAHSLAGLWYPHPQRGFALKLAFESILGPRIYGWLASAARLHTA